MKQNTPLYIFVALVLLALCAMAVTAKADELYQYSEASKNGAGPFQGVYFAIDGDLEVFVCGEDEPWSPSCTYARYCSAEVGYMTPDGELTVYAETCYAGIPVTWVATGGHCVEQGD